jgi:anthranilate synthase/phosphoribosyltransferase
MYLIIDNFDSFTYNVYQVLSTLTDKPVKVIRNDAITVEQIAAMAPEGIIISPGPGRPEEAGVSVAAIRAFAGKIPILGICLGHQAIGYAFGGEIVQAARIVHGKTEEIRIDGRGLFRNIPSPAVYTRYHSLVIEPSSLPAELEITANSMDGEIMGVRHRELLVEGVQFHPESIASETGKALLRNFIHYRREPFPFKAALGKLSKRQDLSQEEAAGFMEELTEGNLSDIQIAGFLMAMEAKGPCAQEIAGCASVLRKKCPPLSHSRPVLDTCGTGGDGLATFNISSMAALAAAACGASIAKHGNRAVSSLSGSADFYGELGLNYQISPQSAKELLERSGFVFLFAPLYHGAMKYAAPARKALGVRTVMNLVGPLANPARAEFQVIGVPDDTLRGPMARAAKRLGVKRVLAVHSSDGMDEFSPAAPTMVTEIGEDGRESEYSVDPLALGIPPCSLDELKGGSAAHNADMARSLMDAPGSGGAVVHAVSLNAGAGLYAYGSAPSIAEGYEMALAAFADGRVQKKVEEVAFLSKGLS